MTLHRNGRLSRRQMLQALSACAAGTSLAPWLTGCRQALETPEAAERHGLRRDALDASPRFLIVVAATGGASIVDSFLAVRASEAGTNASTLNTFADADVQSVQGSPFRAVRFSAPSLGDIPVPVSANQLAFVQKHKSELLVASTLGTSVNHVIAQKRALTGNGAWKGRTLQECVALQYGQGFPIPNVNMGASGYAERGTDDGLPAEVYGEVVANPSLWPLGLDGSRGLKDAPSRDVIALARRTRDQLDAESVFGRTFDGSKALARWKQQRSVSGPQLEVKELISQLNVLPNMPPQIPLTEYGLATSPDGARVRAVFPNFFTDPLEGQAALAYLLLKNRVSVTVTIGPSFNVVLGGQDGIANPPLAFDLSHNDHRAAQAFMWSRVLSVVDRLVDLLKAEPFDATSGQSLWDRSMVYFATDFGRSRNREPNATRFGSGHDLNNGIALLSPMVKGNTVLGGVDPLTTRTFGFDARTGTPLPMKAEANEPDIFSGVLTAMGVDTSGSGLPDASAFKKA